MVGEEQKKRRKFPRSGLLNPNELAEAPLFLFQSTNNRVHPKRLVQFLNAVI